MRLQEEALRYLGVKGEADEELRQRMSRLADLADRRIRPRWTYRVCTVEMTDDGALLREAQLLLPGGTAHAMLETCGRAALLVCTLGTTFDQWLRAEQARDMAWAVMLDAYGSALVEAACDRAEEEISARFPDLYRGDRFSPGYGDLPLDVQPRFLEATDSRRRVGVYVTDSFLLNPQKSVTAVVGLSDQPQQARIRGCAWCSLRDNCALRKGGKHCGT